MSENRFHRRFALKGLFAAPLLPLVAKAGVNTKSDSTSILCGSTYRGKRVQLSGTVRSCLFDDCEVSISPGAVVAECHFRRCQFAYPMNCPDAKLLCNIFEECTPLHLQGAGIAAIGNVARGNYRDPENYLRWENNGSCRVEGVEVVGGHDIAIRNNWINGVFCPGMSPAKGWGWNFAGG